MTMRYSRDYFLEIDLLNGFGWVLHVILYGSSFAVDVIDPCVKCAELTSVGRIVLFLFRSKCQLSFL